jgi:hypothetical protein
LMVTTSLLSNRALAEGSCSLSNTGSSICRQQWVVALSIFCEGTQCVRASWKALARCQTQGAASAGSRGL